VTPYRSRSSFVLCAAKRNSLREQALVIDELDVLEGLMPRLHTKAAEQFNVPLYPLWHKRACTHKSRLSGNRWLMSAFAPGIVSIGRFDNAAKSKAPRGRSAILRRRPRHPAARSPLCPAPGPKHSKQQAANEGSDKAQAQISEEAKAFAIPSDHQPSEASSKQPDNNPDDELIDRRHHRSPQQVIRSQRIGSVANGQANLREGPGRSLLKEPPLP
jgi:hypothetical protein